MCNLGHLLLALSQQDDFGWCQHPGSGRGANHPFEFGNRRGARTVFVNIFLSLVRLVVGVHGITPTRGIDTWADTGVGPYI